MQQQPSEENEIERKEEGRNEGRNLLPRTDGENALSAWHCMLSRITGEAISLPPPSYHFRRTYYDPPISAEVNELGSLIISPRCHQRTISRAIVPLMELNERKPRASEAQIKNSPRARVRRFQIVSLVLAAEILRRRRIYALEDNIFIPNSARCPVHRSLVHIFHRRIVTWFFFCQRILSTHFNLEDGLDEVSEGWKGE